MDPDLEAAHRYCASHRAAVSASERCGCFYCLATFAPSEILDWVDEDANGVGQTALCPRCGIDSVLPSSSGLSIEPEFLRRMRAYWFERTVDLR